LRKSSAHQHPTSDNKEIKSNMSKKSRPEQGAYSVKGEDDVLRINNEVNEDILPWNEKLQTAATKTLENLKGFMAVLSQVSISFVLKFIIESFLLVKSEGRTRIATTGRSPDKLESCFT